jgi:hypothetical protein
MLAAHAIPRQIPRVRRARPAVVPPRPVYQMVMKDWGGHKHGPVERIIFVRDSLSSRIEIRQSRLAGPENGSQTRSRDSTAVHHCFIARRTSVTGRGETELQDPVATRPADASPSQLFQSQDIQWPKTKSNIVISSIECPPQLQAQAPALNAGKQTAGKSSA